MSVPSTAQIRIGIMPPLSGLGTLYGPELSWAAQIARSEINAAGGILGRPLEIVTADDGGLPETAVQTAERLLDIGCLALVGNLPASTRVAVATRVAEPRETPYINCSFYEGSLYGRFFFSLGALPGQLIDRMIPHMARIVGPKMFFVGTNQEWQRASIDAAIRALSEAGGDALGTDFLAADTARIDQVLDRAQYSGTDVLVPFFEGDHQLELLTRFSQRGLKKHMSVAMCNFDEAIAARLPPEAREGLYSSASYFMSLETPANARFMAALSAQADVDGLWPAGNGRITSFGEAAYLAVTAFAKAANTARSLAPGALVEALEHVQIDGPQGPIRMDPLTHHAHLSQHLARCGLDGKLRVLAHFGTRPPVIPERYRYCLPALSGSSAEPSEASDLAGEDIDIAVAGIDAKGEIALFNRTLLRIWGFPSTAQLTGVRAETLWADPEALWAIAPALEQMQAWTGTLTARRADGTLKRLLVAAEPMLSTESPSAGYTLVCIDTHALVSQQQRTSYRILATADVAVIATSTDGEIIEANRRTGELFGYSLEELIGTSIHALIPPQFREQHVHQLDGFLRGRQSERRMGMRNDVVGLRKDGSAFPAEVSISKVETDGRWILVATLRDITDRKLAENELLWRASHDSLTGLPNRTMIHERLARALQRSKNQGYGVALLFIDLDGFKLINDSHGHATGDELLKVIALRLLNQVRPGDIVGRLGGDEFVILCDQVSSPTAITGLAERINDLIRKPVELQGHRLFATASIGLATGHGSTHSADDLLRNADAAMYTAKERGRDDWRFFSEEIHDQVRQRLDITNGLRLAIERNELQVRFQPILCVESGLIRGAELLLRWLPPEGEVPPSQFVPVAEMTGSIVPIGKWVFRQACLAEAGWRERHGSQAPYVSVNISARQLNDETLVETCRADLEETGADPSRVLLELTETSLMSDTASNLRVLRELAGLGLKVAVDDFGTGYSSLSQLLLMPVSMLKIDREFVDGIEKRHESKAIVSAVSSMARAMQLKVVAEGVESELQLDYLRDIGCDYVQGYLFYRPLPPGDFDQLLAERLADRTPEIAQDLYTVLYVSIATQPMSNAELGELLERSRVSNRAQRITGFLLYLNGSFMQVLEGSRPLVTQLLERIAKDPRHHSLQTLYEGPINKRTFVDWSMGFRNMSHIDQGYDFKAWQARTLSFVDMSEDPQACYSLITAFAS